MPKRARIPTKKMRFYEPDPGSPKDDQDGLFVFLTFEDGYSTNIFKVCDVLSKDDKPITCFRDLKPGDVVLARWSDNKFYNATVDYIGISDKRVDAKKGSKKDIKKRDAAAQKFYNLQSLPQAVQSTSAQKYPKTVEHSVPLPTQSSPLPRPQYQPPPTRSSPLPGLQCQPPPNQSSSPTKPQYQPLHQNPPTPPPIPLCYSHPQYPQHHQPRTVQLMPPDQLQQLPVFVDLDQQRKSTTPNNITAKESFLSMLYSHTIPKRSSPVRSQASTSENESCSSSSGSSAYCIIERDPLPEYGEPRVRAESREAWKPCKACQAEVAKLMEEKGKLEDVLCSISGEQLETLRCFLDKVEQIQLQAGVMATKSRSGKQELYPDSGLFLSSTRLAAIHAEARNDCLRLFHLLFDEFFSAEECQNVVPFGKHGKVPEGKAVLDKSKVDGILTYIMRCGTLDGWTPVEKTKVKKALINKCRTRAAKTINS